MGETREQLEPATEREYWDSEAIFCWGVRIGAEVDIGAVLGMDMETVGDIDVCL